MPGWLVKVISGFVVTVKFTRDWWAAVSVPSSCLN